jgi:hypothetical protein
VGYQLQAVLAAAGPVAWLRGEVVLGPLGVAPALG